MTGAGGHLDLAPRQSLCKALKIVKSKVAESRRAKPSSQLVNLPGGRPLMKPLPSKEIKTEEGIELKISDLCFPNCDGQTFKQ